MGRLINPDEFINSNIESYNERAISNYSTQLESTPIFGTYFHQNRILTTNDLGLENVEDDLGRDSPIKYERIEKFPMYGMDGWSLQTERGDMGLNNNIESEMIIIPNTIKPYPNDYFYIDSLGERYLFKVTECQEDMIKSKPYYRVSFRLSKIQDDSVVKEIDKQVIENYTTVFNNIGTDNACIIKTSVFRTIDMVNKITDNLIKFYIRNFYDTTHNVIALRINTLGIIFYNKFLNKFIIDNEIFSYSNKQRDFYSSVKLLEYIPTDGVFDAVYEKTIYSALECQDVRQFFGQKFTYMDINYNHAPWYRSNIDMKDILILSDNEDNIKSDKIMDYLDKEFYGRIKINQPYVYEKDYFMENLIIRYINGDESLPSEEVLNMINTNIWRKDMRAYIYIPLLIFVLRRLVRKETIKQL